MHISASPADVKYLCERFCFVLVYDFDTDTFQYNVTQAGSLEALSLNGK